MIRAIHHVGIAVKRLTDAYRLFRDVLGFPLIREAEIPDQGVRAALLAAGDTEIELLEPLAVTNGVGRFLARHGEGLHHVCFDTPDVASALVTLKGKGAELTDGAGRARRLRRPRRVARSGTDRRCPARHRRGDARIGGGPRRAPSHQYVRVNGQGRRSG